MSKNSTGQELTKALKPHKQDYFILKPMHSGFYATPLQLLLKKLRVHKLFLAGIASDICVLFTANDAYMRGFEVNIISDCVIGNTPEDTDYALKKMKSLLKAKLWTADEAALEFGKISDKIKTSEKL
jgi:nicotinamidase-related amidase